ncbi:hypothetical protein [Streptomyces venezuelae]|uniref:hypothetical protein n=1 Tax=Streptomyces venezuelae TaxID=54571 RepID=UPI00278C82A9|nr:hypothetical protein [Streptomyces venezuelae]
MIAKTSVRRAVLVAAALAALTLSCGTTPEPDGPAAGPRATATSGASGPAATTAEPTTAPEADAAASPSGEFAPSSGEKVRDAFATLQATLNDSCAQDCAYFLGRVHKELQELDGAMKADPKGPGHFPEPIEKIAELNKALDGDSSYENLKKHQKLLVGTRDFINTWMQGHPDDYR